MLFLGGAPAARSFSIGRGEKGDVSDGGVPAGRCAGLLLDRGKKAPLIWGGGGGGLFLLERIGYF